MAGAARRRLLTQAGFEPANPVTPTISLSYPKHITVGVPWRAQRAAACLRRQDLSLQILSPRPKKPDDK
jgi:hypothetical protein